MAQKVAKTEFFRVWFPRQKRRSPRIIWATAYHIIVALFVCPAREIVHADFVQVRKSHKSLYVRLVLPDLIAG